MTHTSHPILQLARRFRADQNGNIMLMMGLAIIPITFAIGFGVDYSRAQKLQTRLNAAADAAALAAIDPAMLFQGDNVAQAAANAMFVSQTTGLSGIASINAPVITMHDNPGGSLGTLRTVTVTYTAQSLNLFSSLLHSASLAVSGTSTASASQPPSINFYVAMDNSPSMLLPTTTAGINSLNSVNNNCAFSCHTSQYDYNAMYDNSGNQIFLSQSYYNTGVNGTAGIYRFNSGTRKLYDGNNNLIGTNATVAFSTAAAAGGPINYTATNGTSASVSVYYADPFWLAENYGKAYPASGVTAIPLRIDAELLAAQNLITTAQNTVANFTNSPTPIIYQMQFFTFNFQLNNLTNSLTNVNNLTPAMLVPSNGTLAPFMLNNFYYPNSLSSGSSSTYTNNSDSGPVALMTAAYQGLPTPGTGATSSSPQEVVIIVTDGYQDEVVNGSQIRQQWNAAALNMCNSVKSRGIRIAILYTTYDPNTVLPDYPGYAAVTPNILPALQSCASPASSGGSLVYQVSANQDISAALNALFAMTVQSARLVQ